jgi:flagellar hook-associated protein 3 FlgL
MLLNINRNMKAIDKLYGQISTAKKIQTPSDDPIVSARALKFRANVSNVEQYNRNVSQGMAWMDVTEGAYNNVIDIMKSIKDRCIEGANGTLESVDRQAVAVQIRQMAEQLGDEMNVAYAGRYVFSGFRTNEPPVFAMASEKRYLISQTLASHDIETTKSYQKLGSAEPPLTFSSNIAKLPYSSSATDLEVDGFTVIAAKKVDALTVGGFNPYDSASIPPGSIVFIEDTGELIISDSDLASLKELRVSYIKDGFEQGELNPKVYFACSELDENGDEIAKYNMDEQDMAYEVSVNADVKINSLACRVYTGQMFADLVKLCDLLESVELSDEKQLLEKLSNDPYNLSDDELEAVAGKQLSNEKAALSSVLHSRFNNMLEMCDRHISNITREHTDLGARMNRLDLVQIRLEQDEGSYKKLMSENEDVDMMEAIMLKANAEAVYQASLKAGAGILQMTLSDFI